MWNKSESWRFTWLTLALSAFAGGDGLTMKVQVPLYQEVSSLDVKWHVGDYAVYEVYEDEKLTKSVGKHKVHLRDIVDIDGTPHFRVTVSHSSDGKDSVLTFHTPVKSYSCDLAKASDIRAKTGFGSFKLSSFESRPGESLKVSSKEVLKIRDREISVDRYIAKYTDGQPQTEIWINNKMAPYGVVKGKVWLDSAYFYYILTDYGNQSTLER